MHCCLDTVEIEVEETRESFCWSRRKLCVAADLDRTFYRLQLGCCERSIRTCAYCAIGISGVAAALTATDEGSPGLLIDIGTDLGESGFNEAPRSFNRATDA